MARLNIDVGTLGNAATGDTLRTAMVKINTNFEDLYLLVGDPSTGLLTTNVTNGDVKIQPNGTGVIEIDQLQINGDAITSIVTNGSVDITGNGTGGVNIEALTFNGTSISSTDSSRINLNENVTVDGDLVVTGSITGTFTVSSVDADSTTVSNLEVDNFKSSAIITVAETLASNDSDTALVTAGAIIDYVDAQDANIASDTLTFTNKSGNISQWTNDSNYATQAYVDARDIGDLSVVGSTISAPSNADLTLTTSGTGSVSIDGIQVSGTEISSTDSTQVTIKENLHVTGSITGDGSGLTGVVASSISSPATIDNITLDDNIISTSSNANLNLNPGGTGTVELQANTNIDGDATATTFIGDLRGPTVFQAKATEDISKGEAVYISGLSGNTPEVALARANSASTMPAFGIAAADIANTATGNIVTFGSCPGHDVSDFGETSITFALGDTIYISSAEAGKLTNVAPTGESNLIQNIGKIERATPTTNMTIKVGGAGRTNATPALDDGNIFIGNGSNQSSTVSLATQIKSYTGLTVVGDDSSGTGFNIGETIKVAGASGITTAVSGDTLTITGSGSGSTGDLTITGSTISSPSNAPLTLDPSGTGKVTAVGGLVVTGGDTETADISSSGDIDAVGFTATGSSTFDGVQITDNKVTSAASNANLELDASGTGGIVAQAAMTFNKNAIFNTGVEEKFATLTGSTGTVTHNCDNGHVFYHTGASGDITANFTNLGLTAEYGTNLTVIINQGATPYEVTAVQIGGAAQTINWQGGSAPTGNANGIDSFSFTILNDGGTYVVLGQMVDFT